LEIPVEKRGLPAYVAEFLGAFLLILFIGIVLSDAKGLSYTDFAVIGLLHAFVLTMLIATLGPTSGAHFNPAVTVTLAALRKISPADAGGYIVSQLAGGVAAALVVKLMLASPADAAHYGAPGINADLVSSNGAAFLAEVIGTFVLMWAIMGAAVHPRGDRHWAPLIIGITLGFAVMAVGPLTGAGLNPARAFGPALVGDFFNGGGTFLFVYVAGPLVGALLAGFGFEALVLRPAHLGSGERPIDTLNN
jgi:MIP family channel proteins